MVIDTSGQAAEQVGHRFDVRVLESAPPALPDRLSASIGWDLVR